MKYIPVDKLIAEIERLRKELPNSIEHLNDEERGFARGQQYELTSIEEEILYLQQEQSEVDFDREIDLSIRLIPGVHSLEDNEQWYKGKYENIKELVYQYYELGLKGRKEK